MAGGPRSKPQQPATVDQLTPRQREVTQLLVRGFTNAEIGELLHISADTVRTHVAAILAALEVSNRTEAAAAYLAWDAAPSQIAKVMERPAIAVLPISTVGADPAAASAGVGITRDLIGLFSRWCWFPVIASVSTHDARALGTSRDIGRALAARFLVDGMLRTSPTTWRLTIDTVDAERGHCVSSDTHDFPGDGLFAVQDEVCQAIVAQAYPRLLASVQAALPQGHHPEDVEAWQLAHAALTLHATREREANERARAQFAAALARDPGLVMAHYGLGLAAFDVVLNQWGDSGTARDELASCAERCTALAPHAAEGWFLGARHAQALGHHDRAAAQLRTAIAHNPSFAAGHALLAQVLLLIGDTDEGLLRMRHACRLTPRAFVAGLAVVHFVRGEYTEALAAATQALASHPRYAFAHAVAGASAWLVGDAATAGQHVRALRAANPDFDPSRFLATFGGRAEAVTRLTAALRAIEAHGVR